MSLWAQAVLQGACAGAGCLWGGWLGRREAAHAGRGWGFWGWWAGALLGSSAGAVVGVLLDRSLWVPAGVIAGVLAAATAIVVRLW